MPICAKCGGTKHVEEIPDILPGIEAPICLACFTEFDARGWNNLNSLADLPYYNPEG